MKGEKFMKRKLIICTLFAIMLSAFILPADARAYTCEHEWGDWEVFIEPKCNWSPYMEQLGDSTSAYMF